MNGFVTGIIRFVIKRALRRIIVGRYRDPADPVLGRLVQGDVDAMLSSMDSKLGPLVSAADFSRLRSRGNRLNLLLGIYSQAMYRSMRELGFSHDRTTELLGDAMWWVYTLGAKIPLWLVRPFSRDPQTRLNFLLRVFLFFPFNEDPNGYRRTYWKEDDRYCTDWHRCVVYDYFREHGTEEEIEFFRRTWCLYDFALPQLISPDGYYERPHTLSSGDEVCDMRWYGRKPGEPRDDPGRGG